MQGPSNAVFLRGTEGKENYLKIGHRDGIVIGVRPLISVTPQDISFKLRLRVMPEIENSEVDAYAKCKEWWPRLRFAKMHAKRCSVILGHSQSTPFYNTEDSISEFIKSNVMTQLQQVFMYLHGVDMDVTPEELYAFLRDIALKAFEDIKEIILNDPASLVDTTCPPKSHHFGGMTLNDTSSEVEPD